MTKINQMTWRDHQRGAGLSGRFQLVNEGMRNQAVGAQQINDAMAQIADGRPQTRSPMQEFERATAHLRGSVEGLNQEIAQFKIVSPAPLGVAARVTDRLAATLERLRTHMLALTFQVGADRVAVDIRRVREVVPRVRLPPATARRRGWPGVFVYRGRVVPVVDLHALRAPASARRT